MEDWMGKEFRLEQLLPLIQETLAQGKTFQFSPRGVSMQPMLIQGRDTVTLAPVDRELKKYDLPLYRRDNGAFVLHRIVKVGDTLTCIAGSMAEAFYGVPEEQKEECRKRLPENLLEVLQRFDAQMLAIKA